MHSKYNRSHRHEKSPSASRHIKPTVADSNAGEQSKQVAASQDFDYAKKIATEAAKQQKTSLNTNSNELNIDEKAARTHVDSNQETTALPGNPLLSSRIDEEQQQQQYHQQQKKLYPAALYLRDKGLFTNYMILRYLNQLPNSWKIDEEEDIVDMGSASEMRSNDSKQFSDNNNNNNHSHDGEKNAQNQSSSSRHEEGVGISASKKRAINSESSGLSSIGSSGLKNDHKSRNESSFTRSLKQHSQLQKQQQVSSDSGFSRSQQMRTSSPSFDAILISDNSLAIRNNILAPSIINHNNISMASSMAAHAGSILVAAASSNQLNELESSNFIIDNVDYLFKPNKTLITGHGGTSNDSEKNLTIDVVKVRSGVEGEVHLEQLQLPLSLPLQQRAITEYDNKKESSYSSKSHSKIVLIDENDNDDEEEILKSFRTEISENVDGNNNNSNNNSGVPTPAPILNLTHLLSTANHNTAAMTAYSPVSAQSPVQHLSSTRTNSPIIKPSSNTITIDNNTHKNNIVVYSNDRDNNYRTVSPLNATLSSSNINSNTLTRSNSNGNPIAATLDLSNKFETQISAAVTMTPSAEYVAHQVTCDNNKVSNSSGLNTLADQAQLQQHHKHCVTKITNSNSNSGASTIHSTIGIAGTSTNASLPEFENCLPLTKEALAKHTREQDEFYMHEILRKCQRPLKKPEASQNAFTQAANIFSRIEYEPPSKKKKASPNTEPRETETSSPEKLESSEGKSSPIEVNAQTNNKSSKLIKNGMYASSGTTLTSSGDPESYTNLLGLYINAASLNNNEIDLEDPQNFHISFGKNMELEKRNKKSDSEKQDYQNMSTGVNYVLMGEPANKRTLQTSESDININLSGSESLNKPKEMSDSINSVGNKIDAEANMSVETSENSKITNSEANAHNELGVKDDKRRKRRRIIIYSSSSENENEKKNQKKRRSNDYIHMWKKCIKHGSILAKHLKESENLLKEMNVYMDEKKKADDKSEEPFKSNKENKNAENLETKNKIEMEKIEKTEISNKQDQQKANIDDVKSNELQENFDNNDDFMRHRNELKKRLYLIAHMLGINTEISVEDNTVDYQKPAVIDSYMRKV
jgi:hypothetical protein